MKKVKLNLVSLTDLCRCYSFEDGKVLVVTERNFVSRVLDGICDFLLGKLSQLLAAEISLCWSEG